MDSIHNDPTNERTSNKENGIQSRNDGSQRGGDQSTAEYVSTNATEHKERSNQHLNIIYDQHCPHRDILKNACELAGWIANITPPTVSPEICKACSRCERPQELNEVTLALAGIKESSEGPGTTLHKVITWFVPQPENCDCPNRVRVMNAWGKERCLQELPTILGWLRESALDNNIPYSEFVISAVVKTILKGGVNGSFHLTSTKKG